MAHPMSQHGAFGSRLRELHSLRTHRRLRESNWVRTGDSDGSCAVRPDETVTLADHRGVGSVDSDYRNKRVLMTYWDDVESLSVLVSLGNFIGAGQERGANFVSVPPQISPQNGQFFGSFFQAPCCGSSRFGLTSGCEAMGMWFRYYIDYDAFDALEGGVRLCASWNCEFPTDVVAQGGKFNADFPFFDMALIDAEGSPSTMHGTGTEVYLGIALCPSQSCSAHYRAPSPRCGDEWSDGIYTFRFHVEDLVPFARSIRPAIERVHGNECSIHFFSMALWYSEKTAFGLTLPAANDQLTRLG